MGVSFLRREPAVLLLLLLRAREPLQVGQKQRLNTAWVWLKMSEMSIVGTAGCSPLVHSPGLHFGPRFLSHTKLFQPQLGPFLGTGLVYIHISHSNEFLVLQPGWVPFFEGNLLLVAFKIKAKGHQSPLPSWTQIPFPPESKRNALV